MSSSSRWSLEAYCALEQARVAVQQEKLLSHLTESSQQFLQHLNLSFLHPFCQVTASSSATATASTPNVLFPAPNVPPMGPLQATDFTMWEEFLNVWYHTAPPLLALSELWLRLFASLLAPLCVAHLLWKYIQSTTTTKTLTTTKTNAVKEAKSHSNGHHSSATNGHDSKNGHHQSNGKTNHVNGTSTTATLSSNTDSRASSSSASNTSYLAWWSILGVASSVVLTTDTLYVLEFGPQFGATWLVLSTLLAVAVVVRNHQNGLSFSTRAGTGVSILLLWCLTVQLLTKHHYDHSLQQDKGVVIPWLSFGNAHDAVLIDEGLYHDASNPTSSRIAQQMTSSSSLVDYAQHATPWMPTGDSRTGLPFLLNQGIPSPSWIRVWLPVPSSPAVIHKNKNTSSPTNHNDNDNGNDLEEYIALDIAFPSAANGGFDPSQPVYLLLHGLNGGSEEEFVMDFTNRRTGLYHSHDNNNTREHATIVVMVARGLMDVPVRGWNVFNGARTSDVREAALALHRTTQSLPTIKPVLAGVGYSMGAIILGNYVARYGHDCRLQAAVAISGGLDMRQVVTFYRAQRLWQPMITTTLRHQFVVDKWGERVRARLTRNELIQMLRSTHITEIDEYAVVAYNGYDDLMHYYSEMSPLGDIPLDEYYNETLLATNSVGKGARIHNVSIPLLVIHALDDPLITWRTVAANRGFLHPSSLTKTGSGNLFLLLTKAGGHVGWPMGWMPHTHGWKWMNNVAKDFVQAVMDQSHIGEASTTTASVQTS